MIVTHTQTQGADGAGTKTAGIGPRTITTSRQTCAGCPALQTKEWTFYGENNDIDSGTDGKCTAAGKVISGYWSERDPTPDWCPALASPRADSAERTAGAMISLPLDDPKRSLNDSGLPSAMIWAGGEAYDNLTADKAIDLDSCSLAVGIYRAMTEAHAKEIATLSPAQPAATPGVPDSLRALSEAVASAAAEQKKSGDLYNAAARRSERTFEDLTEVYETFECADKKLRQAKDALADHCLSLIATQPAGQSAGSGAKTVLTSDGFSGDLIEVPRPAPAPNSTRTGAKCAARRQGTAGGNDPADCDWPMCGCDPHADKVIAALQECGHLLAPAPDSTRTGPAETEETVAKALYRHDYGSYPDQPEWDAAPASVQKRYRALSEAALAARPEAPPDAGWRDISTAPKDGTWILGYQANTARYGGKPANVVRWRYNVWTTWNEYGDVREPTHWRPLPTPPTAPAPSGQAEG